MLYIILKSLHILAVVLFLGNIVTGLFWKHHADRTGDPKLMAHALDGIIRSDRWFTLPGVFAIIATGVALAMVAGHRILGTDWIWMSIVLFSISGAIFGIWVAPLQKRMRAMAAASIVGGSLDMAAYRRLSLTWEIAGVIAILAPVGALVLMVAK